VQGADAGPESKGYLCAQDAAFNLHAARRVTASDRQGREMLCRYILRPPLANERLHLMEDGTVNLEFKRPWKDGTRSIGLEPKALLTRLSAIVPPPRRHVILYFGVLSPHSRRRSQVVPKPNEEPEPEAVPAAAAPNPTSADAFPVPGAGSRNRYIPWHELLRRTFGSEILCPDCGGKLKRIALVKTETTLRTILAVRHLPTGPPKVGSPRPSPQEEDLEWSGQVGEADWAD